MNDLHSTVTLLIALTSLVSLPAAMLWNQSSSASARQTQRASRPESKSNWLKFGRVLALLSLFVVLCLYWIPWPFNQSQRPITQFKNTVSICTKTEGWVQEIYVTDRQYVRQGQVMVVLNNPQLESRLRLLKLDMQESVLIGKNLLEQQDTLGYKSQRTHRKAIQQEIVKTENMLDELTIRAKCDGTVIGDGLQDLLGSYFHAGSEVLVLANPDQEQLAEIRQSQFDQVSEPDQNPQIVFSMPLYSDRLNTTLDPIEIISEMLDLSRLTAATKPGLHSKAAANHAQLKSNAILKWAPGSNGGPSESDSIDNAKTQTLAQRFTDAVCLWLHQLFKREAESYN